MSYTPPAPDHGGGGSGDDSDGDGLSDSQEQAGWYIYVCAACDSYAQVYVTSDPHNPDTDGDGVSDGVEYAHGANPKVKDTDYDGLSDYEEIYDFSTLGYDWNTDNDDFGDKLEIEMGKNPKLKDIYGLSLLISFDWDATYNYLRDFAGGLKKASAYLFDVTDGYLYIKSVTLCDNKHYWNSADIRVYQSNVHPNTDEAGGIKDQSKHINLPHNWDGKSYPWGYSWTHKEAYRTIVHELGHYALFLYDEYIDAYGREYPRVHDDATRYDIPQGPHSFMNFQYKYSEMTSEYNYTHWNPPSGYKTTMQRYINQESCWETFFRMYNSVNGEYKKVIEFDLNGDSIVDSAFWDSYIPKPGPVWDFSDITEVLIYDF